MPALRHAKVDSGWIITLKAAISAQRQPSGNANVASFLFAPSETGRSL